MGMIDRLRSTFFPIQAPGVDTLWPYANIGGHSYPLSLNQTLTSKREDPDLSYGGLVAYAYAANPIVFACMSRRAQLFTEARFQWRQVRAGRPGDMFGTKDLAILETPWTNGTTGDLLGHMIQDVDLAGNAFIARTGDTLVRLRPDWVSIVMGSDQDADTLPWDLDAEVLGYVYQPGGTAAGRTPVVLDASQVAHFAPIPDPVSPYRGMSWLRPVLREIGADAAMTEHKTAFLTNGATPNMIVSFDPTVTKAAFDAYRDAFRQGHEGAANAYRTMFLGGGAKVEVVGKDFAQLSFKEVQGAGETRLASAAGVPPAVAGFSEGLQGSSLNAGNFTASMRLFADLTIRPLWRNACGSLETVVKVPGGAELWYDDRDIAALRENVESMANVQAAQAQSIRTLTDGGFTPESVVDAITSGDLKRLEHSGNLSVQLTPMDPEDVPEPEDQAMPDQLKPFVTPAEPASNGKAPEPAKAGS